MRRILDQKQVQVPRPVRSCVTYPCHSASQCLSERALSAAANAQPANRDSLMPSSPNDILFKRSKADAEANLSPELRLKLFARDILPIRIEQVVNWNNSLPRLDETNFFVLSADVDDPS
jgi:hypothetical protein